MLPGLSKRTLVAQALDTTGCGALLRKTGGWRGLLVLNYHRIGDCQHSLFDHNLWSATTEEFDRQVKSAVRDFDVISLDDLDDVLKRPRGRFVLFTFDDGYLDNYTDAYAVLKAHRAPATFFVTTGFLDRPQVPWWDEIAWMVRASPLRKIPANDWIQTPIVFDEPDRERTIRLLLDAYKRLDGEGTTPYLIFLADILKSGRIDQRVAQELWMTWPMLREMRQAGMSFGGHTVSHPILANISPEEQDFEIGECKRRLVAELGEPIDAFSYPVGGQASFNLHTRAALEKHGFRWAFTYLGGVVDHAADSYSMPRAAIELDVDQPMFRAVLTLPQWFA